MAGAWVYPLVGQEDVRSEDWRPSLLLSCPGPHLLASLPALLLCPAIRTDKNVLMLRVSRGPSKRVLNLVSTP